MIPERVPRASESEFIEFIFQNLHARWGFNENNMDNLAITLADAGKRGGGRKYRMTSFVNRVVDEI